MHKAQQTQKLGLGQAPPALPGSLHYMRPDARTDATSCTPQSPEQLGTKPRRDSSRDLATALGHGAATEGLRGGAASQPGGYRAPAARALAAGPALAEMASHKLLAKGEVKDPRIPLQAAEGQRRSSTIGHALAATEHAPPCHAHTLNTSCYWLTLPQELVEESHREPKTLEAGNHYSQQL